MRLSALALAAEGGVAGGQPGQVIHAVGLRDVALHPAGRQPVGAGAGLFLEGHRNRDDSPVKFGEGDVHRRVDGAETQGAFLPFRAAAGADDALDDGHVQLVQQFLRPAGGYGGASAALLVVQVAHGQAHGVDDAVHAGNAGRVNHVFGEGVASLPVAFFRLVLQAVRKNGQDVHVLRFQPGDEVIHERQIAAHPVGAVEEHSD